MPILSPTLLCIAPHLHGLIGRVPASVMTMTTTTITTLETILHGETMTDTGVARTDLIATPVVTVDLPLPSTTTTDALVT